MTAVHPDAPWATCGIGSLGHEDPDAAVACVLDADLDIPFWPQLPRRGAADYMLPEAALASGLLAPLDARCARWHAMVPPQTPRPPAAAGFESFVRAAAARGAKRVKGQSAGPVTLCAATLLANGETLGENHALRARVFAALSASIAAQTQRLLATGAWVDLWLDEPLLGTATSAPELADWRAQLAQACGPRVRLGVHCCAPPPPFLFELGFDVVSFDAREPQTAPPWLVTALQQQLERGVVAWGILDSEPGRDGAVAVAFGALDAWCARLGRSRDAVGSRSLLTPACGLAGLDPDECAARLGALHALQSRLH